MYVCIDIYCMFCYIALMLIFMLGESFSCTLTCCVVVVEFGFIFLMITHNVIFGTMIIGETKLPRVVRSKCYPVGYP
ncbi:hypothetical protein C2G38_2062494 [Gigaspora rosea]|uniref:Uncharacterized protein n=1 Tax=Gigaspora rosea TaxID=44941 RepID=A0A397VZP1_9GLOM|nr:hypothetical protein C2G38_2062494 [Gigaspora rosea]